VASRSCQGWQPAVPGIAQNVTTVRPEADTSMSSRWVRVPACRVDSQPVQPVLKARVVNIGGPSQFQHYAACRFWYPRSRGVSKSLTARPNTLMRATRLYHNHHNVFFLARPGRRTVTFCLARALLRLFELLSVRPQAHMHLISASHHIPSSSSHYPHGGSVMP